MGSKRLYPRTGKKRTGQDGRVWYRLPLDEKTKQAIFISKTTTVVTVTSKDPPPSSKAPPSRKSTSSTTTTVSVHQRFTSLFVKKGEPSDGQQ